MEDTRQVDKEPSQKPSVYKKAAAIFNDLPGRLRVFSKSFIATLRNIPGEIKKSGHPPANLILFVIGGFVLALFIFSVISRLAVKRIPKKEPYAPVVITDNIVEEKPVVARQAEIKPLAAMEQAAPKNPAPSLILTGIVFSEDGKSLALINSRIVKEGGMIEGALLEKIESDQVRLIFEDKRIILRSR